MLFPGIMLLLAGAVVAMVLLHYRASGATVRREEKMIAMDIQSASSYEQKTNHFVLPSADMGPMTGTESPFRVNAYHAYM